MVRTSLALLLIAGGIASADAPQDAGTESPTTPVPSPASVTSPRRESPPDGDPRAGAAKPAEEALADPRPPAIEDQPESLAWSYLTDGGALPFIWGTGSVALGFRLFVKPPDTPRLFSSSEGGAPVKPDTVPETAVGIYAIAGAGVLGLLPTSPYARFYHVKGYAEAMMTNAALTEVAKATFGRHRPSWTADAVDVDRHRSFFSGHASFMFATGTYLSLYMHDHVFARWRDPDQAFAWWEALPYTALAGAAAGVAITRVEDNRHHPSDVITGAVVGTGVATTFYLWQESRYRRRHHSRRVSAGHETARLQLVPAGTTLSLVGQW